MTARIERPLSPHLQTYRWTLTMALSIVHRATGVALYFGTLLLAWWLIAAASGPTAYANVQAFTGSAIGKLIVFGYTWALMHHLCSGIRHFVWDLGYGKDLVISGGFNAYPKEIESEIDAMPGVIESAVIGVPHADFGEGVTAVLVCSKGADVSEASVLKALDGRIAKFKMPKRVFVVDELPRNAMGKVQKNILRDTYKDIYSKA